MNLLSYCLRGGPLYRSPNTFSFCYTHAPRLMTGFCPGKRVTKWKYRRLRKRLTRPCSVWVDGPRDRMVGGAVSPAPPRVTRQNWTARCQLRRSKSRIRSTAPMNAHCFRIIVELENRKWNRCKLGTACIEKEQTSVLILL